jgi:DNA mismatch repair protein MSH6
LESEDEWQEEDELKDTESERGEEDSEYEEDRNSNSGASSEEQSEDDLEDSDSEFEASKSKKRPRGRLQKGPAKPPLASSSRKGSNAKTAVPPAKLVTKDTKEAQYAVTPRAEDSENRVSTKAWQHAVTTPSNDNAAIPAVANVSRALFASSSKKLVTPDTQEYDRVNEQRSQQQPSSEGRSPNDVDSVTLQQLPEGVLGVGHHEHNMLPFLLPDKRRDHKGRSRDHPDYNPRTALIPESYMREQTPAMYQWWHFKGMNMDTVLFFKVGKFYELFHMDADVGFTELDLVYMKGSKGHSGFPEVAYGKFSSILVSKGYRVARVEQTETPEMLKERNDASKGKKDKVGRF